MSGLILESEELAWLLNALHAKAVVGLDDPSLFPGERQIRDATWDVGLKKLQEHKWVVPAQGPGQWRMNDDLMWLVAVVADPEFVLVTIRSRSKSEQTVVLHYLADKTIVQLTAAGKGQYGLGVVPDLATLWSRMGDLLALPAPGQASASARFSIDPQMLTSAQELVAAGEVEAAAAVLRKEDLAAADREAFLAALAGVARGEMGVVHVIRAQAGQVQSDRKVTFVRQAGQAWLVHRPSEGAALTVESVQDGSLGQVLGPYLDRATGAKP